jgi:serine/threonine-protein kinase
MGEVYKAKDQKLGRDVAIKVLPEEFAKDADRVARFQREAKLLASLNHPNIAAIYGLEESSGIHFLVLELIEGDTLADRLKRGAIPVEESLKLALQIAEALEAAHEKGVIHRDLKPANIKITPDGKIKVLDFGLAKAFAGEQSEVNLSHSPTLSEAATLQGVILGTAAYMSPEQARGKPVDKRTDIWAFGCVLYEMLTGKAAFQGEDVTEILAAVVKSGVNLDLLPANIHPRVRELLTRCLQKDPKRRYSGISDVQYEIEQVLTDPSGVFVQPVTSEKPRKKLRVGVPWVATALILGLIIAGVAVWYLKPPEPRQVTYFDYHLPEDQNFSGFPYNIVAVSSDGSKIVYAANQQLYLKNSNELTARPIQGSDEDPLNLFFSPDGKWVGYESGSDGSLKKIAIMGGVPVTLCSEINPAGANWGTDDMIVFGRQGSIMRVSASGGIPEEIIEGEGERFLYPQILPDGETVLFSIYRGYGDVQVALQSLKTGQRKELFEGNDARFLPSGHIIYTAENGLYAIPFDLDTLEISGGPVPLIEGIFRGNPTHPAQWAISDSGTLVYIPGGMRSTAQSTLVWVDREGKEAPLEAEPNDYSSLKISPDGTRVALSITEDENRDMWVYDLIRGTKTRLTRDEADDFLPIWTPDSQRVIFGSIRDGSSSICWKKADGTGQVEQIASVPDGSIWPLSLSSDGNTLFFGQNIEGQTGRSIGMLSMEGDRNPELLIQEEYNQQYAQISPDGRWLAYWSEESGQEEVYIRAFPDVDSGGRWQVSTRGGRAPLWSPDGRELFYWGPDGIMAVPLETDPIFKLGIPQKLFSGPYFFYEVSPDGKRFLMIKRPELTDEEMEAFAPRKINFVVNWFEELQERVPVD